MIKQFFNIFERERLTISQNLYGENSELFKKYPDLKSVFLKKTQKEGSFLLQILNKRKSSTEYSGDFISLDQLSNILETSVGLKKDDPSKRMYPSGGAKYPCEIYAVTLKVSGLDQGIYHYGPEKHSLTKISSFSESLLQELLFKKKSNFALFDSAVIIFITFSPERSIRKYGDFSYKLGLIEAGHIGQNFYLTTTEMELGCRAHAIGETEEETQKINDILLIDGIGETFIYALSIGKNP